MPVKFAKSMKYAYEGLYVVFRSQRNFRIQVFVGVTVLVVALILDLGNIEWIILIWTIATVLVSEIVNTIIETIVDLHTAEIHPKAKLAKDLSASLVLLNAIVAIIVGSIIIIPHVLNFF